jgi:hypothetical protein
MTTRKISISVALRKIRAHKPTSPAEFKKIGLPLRWLKSGVFRESLRVINCDLVVKFPLAVGRSRYTGEGKRHTRTEISRWRRLRRYRFMHRYLPTIYYHDKASGTLVMSYHPKFADFEKQVDALGEFIQKLILQATGVRTTDLHGDNVHERAPKAKRAVIIDLGY